MDVAPDPVAPQAQGEPATNGEADYGSSPADSLPDSPAVAGPDDPRVEQAMAGRTEDRPAPLAVPPPSPDTSEPARSSPTSSHPGGDAAEAASTWVDEPAGQPAEVGIEGAEKAEVDVEIDDVELGEDQAELVDDWEETPVFPIAAYDELRVLEIVPLLDELDPDELAEVRDHEAVHQARGMILRRCAALLGEPASPMARRPDPPGPPVTPPVTPPAARPVPAPPKAAAKAQAPARKAAATPAGGANGPTKRAPKEAGPAGKVAKPAGEAVRPAPAQEPAVVKRPGVRRAVAGGKVTDVPGGSAAATTTTKAPATKAPATKAPTTTKAPATKQTAKKSTTRKPTTAAKKAPPVG